MCPSLSILRYAESDIHSPPLVCSAGFMRDKNISGTYVNKLFFRLFECYNQGHMASYTKHTEGDMSHIASAFFVEISYM